MEAGLALAALALIVRIPGLDRTPERAPERTLWSVAGDGLRTIVAVPALRGVTAAAAFGMAGLGLLTVAFPLFAVEHLGVERSAAGYMWAAFAVGSTLGALSLVRLQHRFRPERIVFAGYAVFGLLMFTWPLAEALPVFLALVALAALADGPALASQFAVRQEHRAAVALRAGIHDSGRVEGGLAGSRRRGRRSGCHGAGLGRGARASRHDAAARLGGGAQPRASPGSSGPRRSCSPGLGS